VNLVSRPIILFIFTQSLVENFEYEAAKDRNRIVAVFVLAGSNDVKHCGEKTKFDKASQYSKSVDDLLEKATKKLRNWSVLIDAPVFLIGSGTPCNVFPTSDVPNV
jgi:hypothetical protein